MAQNPNQDPITLDAVKTAILSGAVIDGITVGAMEGPSEVIPAAAIGAGVGFVATLGAGLSRTDRLTQTTVRIVSPITSALVEGAIAVAQHSPTHWVEWVGAGTRATLSALSSLATNLAMTKDTRPNR